MLPIEVDFHSLEEAGLALKTAVDDFDICYKEFVGSAMQCLESYSSDYLVEFEKLLRIYKDDRTKKTIESVFAYCQELNDIFDIWVNVNEDVAMKIEGGNEGC